MTIKTNVKAGKKGVYNHNQGLRVATNVKAGTGKKRPIIVQ